MLKRILGVLLLLNLIVTVVGEEKKNLKKWTDRLLPLPKEIQVSEVMTCLSNEVVLAEFQSESLEIKTAKKLISSFADGNSQRKAKMVIKLILNDDEFSKKCPEISKKLKSLTNSDQAYAIITDTKNDKIPLISLVGNTDAGILYAAMTMHDLIIPDHDKITPAKTTKYEIPLVRIVDWPDFEERGFWSVLTGHPPFIKWMGKHKLNLVAGAKCKPMVGKDGKPYIKYKQETVDLAVSLGIRVVPLITHFNGFVSYNLYNVFPELRGVAPNPKAKPIPKLDDPKFREIYKTWIKQMADIKGVKAIDAWLNEGYNFDKEALANHPDIPGHIQETRLILEAWREARKKHPDLMIRIMLSQGSLDFYEQILKEIPDRQGVLYYHGSYRPVCPGTYSMTRRKIIIPVLEKYVADGKWLGVVPVLANLATNSLVSSPQFIKYRLEEFKKKGLKNITAFATPDLVSRELNFSAFAEWSWNLNGRNTYEFARVWAIKNHLPRPELTAEWLDTIGPVIWDLGASLVPGGRFNIMHDLIKKRPVSIFGKQGLLEMRDIKHVNENLAVCDKALKLAKEIGNEKIIAESLATQGLYQMIKEFHFLSQQPAPGKELTEIQLRKIRKSLNRLIDAALQVVEARKKENEALYGKREIITGRWLKPLINTENIVSSCVDEFIPYDKSLKKLKMPIWKKVGEWDSTPFKQKTDVKKQWEVTSFLDGPGVYDILMQAKHGPVVRLKKATLISEDKNVPVNRKDIAVDDHKGHTFLWHLMKPIYRFKLNKWSPEKKYFIVVDMKAPIPKSQSGLENTKGIVLLKKKQNKSVKMDVQGIVQIAKKYLKMKGDEKKKLEAELKNYNGPIGPVIEALKNFESKNWDVETPYDKGQKFTHPELKDKYEKNLMFFRIPKTYSKSKPVGLLIFMHGGGVGSPPDAGRVYMSNHKMYGLGPIIDKSGFIAVAPTAPIKKTSNRWNVPEAEEYLDDVIRECKYRFNIDPDRVVLFGYSMGACGAYGLSQRMGDKFAACTAANGNWQAANFNCLEGTPFCIIHGENDAVKGKRPRFTDVFYARSAKKLLDEAGVENLYLEHPLGHGLEVKKNAVLLKKCLDWMATKQRDPFYPHVIAIDPRGKKVYRSNLSTPHSRWVTILEKGNDTISADYIKRTGPGPKWKEPEENFDKQNFLLTKTKAVKGGIIDANYIGKNLFEVKTQNVKKFSLWLSPEMVDFSKPINVVVNGQKKVFKNLKPNLLDALKSYERRHDWNLIYPCELQIKIE